MEKKPTAQRLLIIAGILILTLGIFFAGGMVLSSAHAESLGKPGQPGTPGPVNGGNVNLSGTITNIDGSTITVQTEEKQGNDQTFTILVTDSTTFSKVDLQTHTKSLQPASFSDLTIGETIEVDGTWKSDGSLTASNVVIVPSDGGTK
jgi:Domain of unknown function (DUF5666)